MPTQYCFLCASDEGVFLDITTENIQTFRTQFEICSLVRVPTSNKSQTKICHKCVYELNQCSNFLQKYKKIVKHRSQNRKSYCSFCYQLRKKEYVFDLSKENSLQLKSIEKIQQVLNDEVDKIQGDNILVCLSCRYTVDVLSDLKNLSNEIASTLENKIEKDIDYSRFPKVKTSVISRKTTITESAKVTLKPRENTNSDSDMMKCTRSKAKLQDSRVTNKVIPISDEQKLCIECHNPVKANSDSHVNERMGQSVCNDCWDNNRSTAKDADAQQSLTETKVCKVFLKDVLGQTATQKGKKVDEVEKDNRNKKKSKSAMLSKEFKESVKTSDSVAVKVAEKRSNKSTNIDDTDDSDIPNKKQKRGVKGSLSDQETTISSRVMRKRKGTGANSDSDYPLNSSNAKESKGTLIRHRRAIGTSLSDADVDTKSDRRKLRGILAESNAMKNISTIDESPADDGASKKKKLRFTNDPLTIIDLTNTSDEGGRRKRNMAKRTTLRSALANKSSVESEKTESVESEKTESVESEAKDSSAEEEIKTYSCEECGVNYENKVVFMTHQLSHYRQPKLELQKLTADSKPKEVSLDTGEANDEQSEDQSEGIKITVDDDEEETEVETNNLESSTETAVSSKVEAPKDTVDTKVVSKESDNDQLTEKDEKDSKSIQSRTSRSRSGSVDKDNDQNISEQAEEEDVEDISLTNLEDDQEEGEEEEEEKGVGQGTEKEQIGGNEKEAESENTIVDVVNEAEEAEADPKETISEEKSVEDVHQDDDIDKLDSSKKIEANVNQEGDKPEEDESNGNDASNEKDDTKLSEKPEENPVEEKEDLNISDTPEENIEDKSKSVDGSRDSADESQKNHIIEKETVDSTDKPAEGKVTRRSTSRLLEKAEGTDKLDSPEKPQEISGSPSRKSRRRGKSSNLGKIDEDKQGNCESSEEREKTVPGSPGNLAKSPERRSSRRGKSVSLAKSEEDKKSEEVKDKAVSPETVGKSPERKSPRKSKSVLFVKSEENKKDSAEKHEENDKSESLEKSEEKKVTRKSKSVSFTKSKGKDKQDSPENQTEEKSESSEKQEDKLDSSEKSEDKLDSPEKQTAEEKKEKSECSEKPEESESEGEKGDEVEEVVEINENSSDDVMEVCEKEEPGKKPSVNDAEEVQEVSSDNDNSCDIMEICERKNKYEVECIEEVNPPDEPDKKTRNSTEKGNQEIVVAPTSDSADVAAEILQEVLDFASAEIQKRRDVTEVDDKNDENDENDEDAETLENISREVQNGGDKKSRESHVRFSTKNSS